MFCCVARASLHSKTKSPLFFLSTKDFFTATWEYLLNHSQDPIKGYLVRQSAFPCSESSHLKCWLSSSLFPQNLGSQTWQQSVASTLDTYLVIEDLTPNCKYQFRVSASNPWGISLPSEASEFVKLPENGEHWVKKGKLSISTGQ